MMDYKSMICTVMVVMIVCTGLKGASLRKYVDDKPAGAFLTVVTYPFVLQDFLSQTRPGSLAANLFAKPSARTRVCAFMASALISASAARASGSFFVKCNRVQRNDLKMFASIFAAASVARMAMCAARKDMQGVKDAAVVAIPSVAALGRMMWLDRQELKNN